MHRFNYSHQFKERGFTLIEVMVVVVIMGILAAIVVPQIMSRPDQAKITKAQQDILAIQSALDLYKLDNGFYPTTDQGLQALVHQPTSPPIASNWKAGGYLKDIPIDPWGHPYHYLNPGNHNLEGIDIFSYGATGQPGGSIGVNATFGNWSNSDNNQSADNSSHE